jgi:hypothetical protein
MTTRRTAGRVTESKVIKGVIAHDSAKGAAPKGLVLPVATQTPAKPAAKKE